MKPASYFVWAVLVGCLFFTNLRAHDAGLSVAEARVKGETVELTVSFAMADVQRMLPPSVRFGTDSSQSTIENAQAELDQLASLLWEVRVDGVLVAPVDMGVAFTPSDNLGFHFTYARPAGSVIVFRSTHLAGLPAKHSELFTFLDANGRPGLAQTLTKANDTIRVSVAAMSVGSAAPVPPGQIFGEFFKLGLEHIWTGYDHLLFLFGLLLVCRSFRSILIVVTSFTVAHSITLALAALEVVNVPAGLVEPLIAASIVFVGVENILRKDSEPRGRGWLTFGFGLIHGFGFASVLRDLGVGAHGGGIGLPLLSFNLGVEIGQVSVAAVVLPILVRVFRSAPIRRRGVVIGSSIAAAAGLYWLVERTIFT